MGQGDLVAVGLDRRGEPIRRNLSGERDLTGDRRIDEAGAFESNIYSAMLSTGVGVVTERELTKDAAVRRPRPCLGTRSESEREADSGHHRSQHCRCPRSEHASTVTVLWRRGNVISQTCHREER